LSRSPSSWTRSPEPLKPRSAGRRRTQKGRRGANRRRRLAPRSTSRRRSAGRCRRGWCPATRRSEATSRFPRRVASHSLRREKPRAVLGAACCWRLRGSSSLPAPAPSPSRCAGAQAAKARRLFSTPPPPLRPRRLCCRAPSRPRSQRPPSRLGEPTCRPSPAEEAAAFPTRARRMSPQRLRRAHRRRPPALVLAPPARCRAPRPSRGDTTVRNAPTRAGCGRSGIPGRPRVGRWPASPKAAYPRRPTIGGSAGPAYVNPLARTPSFR